MGNPKIVLNGTTLIDLTSDTVASNKMLSGVTAHSSSGDMITGTIITNNPTAVSASGSAVTVPSGYYENSITKIISAGSATIPATTITANPTINISASGLITTSYSNTEDITPSVVSGYISSGTAGTVTVTGSSTLQLNTLGVTTYTPSSTTQTIDAGYYLTGIQTVQGDSNFVAANIASGVTIFGVLGTHQGGTDTDDATLNNSNQMLNGVTAYAKGSKYTGSIPTRSSANVTVSGSAVSIQSGYYANAVSTNIAAAAYTSVQNVSFSPNFTINNSGIVNATQNIGLQTAFVTSSGYIDTTAQLRVGCSGTSSYQLNTQAATTINPTESEQVAVAASKYTTGIVKVGAVSSDYVGSNIAQRSSGDLTASGSVVTIPSGYYATQVIKNVDAGSVTIADTSIGLGRNKGLSLTVQADGYVVAAVSSAQEISPTITSGYISNGTSGIITITGSIGAQIQTQGSKTVTPTESTQTAVSSGVYTTGIVKVDAIPSDYIGSAIASVSVVEGTTTVSGTTATRGDAAWSAGIIAAGNMGAATFANSSSSQTQYVDISNTTEAPVLVSGGYLYINKGYTDDLKISLAKLVPDGASADLVSGVILSGYAAYDNDGNLVAGNIPTKSSANVSASGSTVTVPSGYYASAVATNITAATYNSTHSVNFAPNFSISNSGVVTATQNVSLQTQIVNSPGYVDTNTNLQISCSGTSSYQLSTQAAKTVTPTESVQTAVASHKYTTGTVTVGAISSNYIGSNIPARSSANLSASGSVVTAAAGYYANAASKAVAAGTATTPATTITANPEISVNTSTGVITATTASSKSVTPTISAGYINTGTAGTVTVSGTTSSALSIQAAATITPTESVQTAVSAGKYTTGAVTVGAISSTYVGSGITQRSSDDLTFSNGTFTTPSGYYVTNSYKNIAVAGNAPTPSLSLNSSTGVVTASVAVMSAWYNSDSASKTYQLTTASASTYIPSTTTQTIPSGVYLTGAQTIAAVPNASGVSF